MPLGGGLVDCHYDGFVGMAQVLDLMTSTGRTLSQLRDALPKFHIHKSKVTVSADRLPELYKALTSQHTDATPTTTDGLRLAWNDKWLLVRGSNTEPIVRIMAEAPDEAEAQRLCDEAARVIGAV